MRSGGEWIWNGVSRGSGGAVWRTGREADDDAKNGAGRRMRPVVDDGRAGAGTAARPGGGGRGPVGGGRPRQRASARLRGRRRRPRRRGRRRARHRGELRGARGGERVRRAGDGLRRRFRPGAAAHHDRPAAGALSVRAGPGGAGTGGLRRRGERRHRRGRGPPRQHQPHPALRLGESGHHLGTTRWWESGDTARRCSTTAARRSG